jgi:hypothetical protein
MPASNDDPITRVSNRSARGVDGAARATAALLQQTADRRLVDSCHNV